MKKQVLTLLAALLLLLPLSAQNDRPYLSEEEVRSSVSLLPPPPAEGTIEFLMDKFAYWEYYRLRTADPERAAQAIREADDKGRHTTSMREMIALPNGGVVIDTPGMRELGIETADIETAFADIEQLALECRFSDCRHETEPDCAVKQAVADGRLDARRLESYLKLRAETERR